MNVQRFAVPVVLSCYNIYIIFLATVPRQKKHWLCLKGSTNESEILIQRATTHVSYRDLMLGVCSDTYTYAWQEISVSFCQICFLIKKPKKQNY